MSPADCRALQGLLDEVNPIPYHTVVQILEHEYRKPLKTVFRAFEEKPLGSASVSQVHKAELFEGSIVAVKIKRPQVDRMFFYDIRILKRLARVAELFSTTLRHVQIREMTNYFESWIKQDLDFLGEVRNMKRFREEYKFAETQFRSGLGKQVLPRPYDALCTESVIVMDFIDGIPLTKKEQITTNPLYDIKKSVKLAVNAPVHYWFGPERAAYVFQADPHFSNILALPHGDVASIDFGLISEFSPEEADRCKDLVLAVYLQDVDKVLHIVADMTAVSLDKYAPILRPDVEIYVQKAQKEGFGFWFMELAKIMVKHRLKFPLSMITFGRSYVITDGLINTYLPGHTTVDIFGEELRHLAFQQTIDNVINADWLKLLYTLSQKVEETPDLVTEFINDPLSLISAIAKAIKYPI
jgi:ubiquinone biosynthesis protein